MMTEEVPGVATVLTSAKAGAVAKGAAINAAVRALPKVAFASE